MWGTTPFDQLLVCRIKFRSLRYEGPFTPPSEQGTLVFPGNFGVFDWGGISVDPVRQILIANPDYIAFTSKLIPREKLVAAASSTSETSGIKQARGTPFAYEMRSYRRSAFRVRRRRGATWQAWICAPARSRGYTRTARSATTRRYPFRCRSACQVWRDDRDGGRRRIPDGHARSVRARLRRARRQKLWEARLPAGGQSMPMSYADASGKQYIFVTAGGHGSLGTKAGDYVIAYTLQ